MLPGTRTIFVRSNKMFGSCDEVFSFWQLGGQGFQQAFLVRLGNIVQMHIAFSVGKYEAGLSPV